MRTSELLELDLSDNEPWADGEALADAFEAYAGLLFTRVPLLKLKILRLERCRRLRALPRSITRLQELRELQLASCEALRALPEQIGANGANAS